MSRLIAAMLKLRRIFTSDLSTADRYWYLADELLERLGLPASRPRAYGLRDGSKLTLRAHSTDAKVFDEVFIDQIYGPFIENILRKVRPSVLVDLGANIGLSSLFFDRRLRFQRIIAVEPDYGNIRAMRRNLTDNLRASLTVVQGFAGAQRGFATLLDAGYGAWGLRMGDPAEDGVPVLPMQELVPDVPGGVLLKCDIEGAERYIFPRIQDWDHQVRYVILELHTEFFTLPQLQEALAGSHYEWRVQGTVTSGAVLAVLSLERGVLKVESESDSRSASRRAAAV